MAARRALCVRSRVGSDPKNQRTVRVRPLTVLTDASLRRVDEDELKEMCYKFTQTPEGSRLYGVVGRSRFLSLVLSRDTICDFLPVEFHTVKEITDHDLDLEEKRLKRAAADVDDYLKTTVDLNENLQQVQAETFLAAFESRYLGKNKISEDGRRNFRELAATGKLKTVMKYALAQPMALLTKYGKTPVIELPPVPKGFEAFADTELLIMDILKITGTSKMRLYSHLTETTKDKSAPTKRAIKWCFELTQMKNLCPKLTFGEVMDSIRDHHDTLTDASNPEVSRQVERVVDTLARSLFPMIIPFSKLPPGTLTDRSALVESGYTDRVATIDKLRSGLGFKARVSGTDEIKPENPPTEREIHRRSRMVSYALAFDQLIEMNVHDSSSQGKDLSLYELRGRPDRDTNEDEIMEPFLDTRDYPIQGNRACVVALLEPLKIRTISIDSGILRYLASRIQKYMWNTISKFRVFDLIRGVPVEDTLEFMVRGLPFVSGDYKGATDSIFHNSTDLWVHQIFSRLAVPPHLQSHIDAIKRDFTRVLLDYSSVYDQEGRVFLKAYAKEKNRVYLKDFFSRSFWEILFDMERDFPGLSELSKSLLPQNTIVQQARGQLMGNVLSFPILCLINLTGYLVAAERFVNHFGFSEITDDNDRATWYLLTDFFSYESNGKRRLKRSPLLCHRLPVRVNGDDILFQGSNLFYQIWSNAIKDVGFLKSVGKNYYSEYFFTVNSQIFVPNDFGTLMYNEFCESPSRINHLWWSGLSPDFLRRRTDFRSLVGKDAATIADSRMFLSTVQREFLITVPQGQRSIWNTLFLENNKEFISSFDSLDKELSFPIKGKKAPAKGHFTVSRTLPVKLGGLGLELPYEEKLTYSQKTLAFRLLNSEGQAPYHLGESPLINTLLKPFRKYLEARYPIRMVSPIDRRLLEENNKVVDLTTFLITSTARLYPFWREPPPDDISFSKTDLAKYTEDMFRWALTCRRGLKRIAEEMDFSPTSLASAPLDRVVIFPLKEDTTGVE